MREFSGSVYYKKKEIDEFLIVRRGVVCRRKYDGTYEHDEQKESCKAGYLFLHPTQVIIFLSAGETRIRTVKRSTAEKH